MPVYIIIKKNNNASILINIVPEPGKVKYNKRGKMIFSVAGPRLAPAECQFRVESKLKQGNNAGSAEKNSIS